MQPESNLLDNKNFNIKNKYRGIEIFSNQYHNYLKRRWKREEKDEREIGREEKRVRVAITK